MDILQTLLIVLASVIPLLFLILWPIRPIHMKSFDFRRALSEPGSGEESISRYLLFLSGCSAILFSYVFVIFYIYAWLELPFWCSIGKCKEMPDFSVMINGLLALGIGVVPYSVNKISAAASTAISARKIKLHILMKTITYKATIKDGGGQLTIAAPNKPLIQFKSSGSKPQDLEDGVQQIVVICTPDDGAQIKFEILKDGVGIIEPYTFTKREEKIFIINV